MGFVGLGLYGFLVNGNARNILKKGKAGGKWKSCKGKKHCSHSLRLWSYLSSEQAWIRHGLKLGSSQEACLPVTKWSPDSALPEEERQTLLVNECGFANSKHPHEYKGVYVWA